MSKPEEEQPAQEVQEDVDIQHDDEFEDFKVTRTQAPVEEAKKADWMDDWDDDAQESFSAILKEQRKH